jgi:hypothetical protein
MEQVMHGVLPRTVQTAVVYDLQTGAIQHVHQHIALEGGVIPDHEQVENRAIEIAVGHGRDPLKLKVLHVAADTLQGGKRYKVDVNGLTVVETGSHPIPGRRP